jgi:hypothetical protein
MRADMFRAATLTFGLLMLAALDPIGYGGKDYLALSLITPIFFFILLRFAAVSYRYVFHRSL